MISKVLDGHSSGPACKYICNRKEVEILEAEGVRATNFKEMAMDFQAQANLREHKKQACFHGVLSFHPDDKVDKETMKEIARKYLEGIDIKNTQYVIALHTDKKHLHLHLLANMVNYEGRSIHNGFIGYRGKEVAIKLTEEYNLIAANRKDLSRTNLEALNASEVNRYKVYQAITESLPSCRTMEDLESRLARQGITMQYKYKSGTQEKQGISFKIGEDCIKGSKVDRQYSLSGLEKILEQNRKQAAEISKRLPASTKQLSKESATAKDKLPIPVPSLKPPETIGASLFDILMEPVPDYEGQPPTWKKKKRRR